MDPNVQQTLDCIKPNNKWPDALSPGLPNMCQAMVIAVNVGVAYCTPFLPPNPMLPIPPPVLPLFQGPFMAAAQISSPTALSFANAVIFMIWEVFVLYAATILALSPQIPSESVATTLFTASLAQFGLVNVSFPIDCIPKTVIKMMHQSLLG